MIFDFFKKLFWKADENNRKRKPSEFTASNRENYSPTKKHCSESSLQLRTKIIEEADKLHHKNYCNFENKSNMSVLKPKLLENDSNYGNFNNSTYLFPIKNYNVRASKQHNLSQNDHSFWQKQKTSNPSTLFETHKIQTRKQYDELLQSYNFSRGSCSSSSQTLDESTILKEKLYPTKIQSLSKNQVTPSYNKKMDSSVRITYEQLNKSNSLSKSLQKLYLNRENRNKVSLTEDTDKTTMDTSFKQVEMNNSIKFNTMRESLSSKAVIKRDFVAEIMKKYNGRMEQKLKEAERLKKMTYQLNKQNQLIREACLENQLNRSMKLYEEILDEKIFLQVEPKLPELTTEMMEKVQSALSTGPGHQILVEEFGLRITRKDMHTLSGLNWLNDEVINFYMNLLIKRGSQDNFPNVYAMNTFFYPKLLSGGHASLKRWTRKVDLFSKDLVVVPVHLGIHWCMSVIDFRNKSIRYFDSMGAPNHKCLQSLRQYLQDECLDKKKNSFDFSNWNFENVKDIPQQNNGSDCGVFSCVFAEHICANRDFNFSQDDMPYFRNKMVYEILTAQLL